MDSIVARALNVADFINGIGQKQTLEHALRMSALPPEADTLQQAKTPSVQWT